MMQVRLPVERSTQENSVSVVKIQQEAATSCGCYIMILRFGAAGLGGRAAGRGLCEMRAHLHKE